MDPMEARARLDDLSAEIALKYGITGTFSDQIAKIRRALPRYERARADDLAKVESALEHPTHRNELMREPFERAETALLMHLERVDRSERIRAYALDAISSVLLNVVLAAIAVGVLYVFIRS
ncbi:MAG: hypothetical protein AAF092_07505 [Pseudomonadota bacterium]